MRFQFDLVDTKGINLERPFGSNSSLDIENWGQNTFIGHSGETHGSYTILSGYNPLYKFSISLS